MIARTPIRRQREQNRASEQNGSPSNGRFRHRRSYCTDYYSPAQTSTPPPVEPGTQLYTDPKTKHPPVLRREVGWPRTGCSIG
ncbi:hypothetical protein PGQ11_010254 [Apiospora arundinis]|uniref:Uncharacterized protein n=1 Tax=Apiospora arundinis TaxID=335852 RepID=A0ABR2IA22_9PEZI